MNQPITLLLQPNAVYNINKAKKSKRSKLKIASIKVKLFFWNLSPIHWYDTFKDIHVDMNEFISPKKIK